MDEDDEDEDETDTKKWGKKKTYWTGDTADLEIGQDIEDAVAEEEAARDLQQQKLKRIKQKDFRDDLEEDSEDEEDESEDNADTYGSKLAKKKAADKKAKAKAKKSSDKIAQELEAMVVDHESAELVSPRPSPVFLLCLPCSCYCSRVIALVVSGGVSHLIRSTGNARRGFSSSPGALLDERRCQKPKLRRAAARPALLSLPAAPRTPPRRSQKECAGRSVSRGPGRGWWSGGVAVERNFFLRTSPPP
jgi:hypothetical protein